MTIPQPLPPSYLTDFSPFFLLGSIVLFYALHIFYRATKKSVENFFFGSKRDSILTILGYTYALSFFFNSFILSLLTAADWVSVGSTLVSTLGSAPCWSCTHWNQRSHWYVLCVRILPPHKYLEQNNAWESAKDSRALFLFTINAPNCLDCQHPSVRQQIDIAPTKLITYGDNKSNRW